MGRCRTDPLGWSPGDLWALHGYLGTDSYQNFLGTIDYYDFVAKAKRLEGMPITIDGKIGIGTVRAHPPLQVIDLK